MLTKEELEILEGQKAELYQKVRKHLKALDHINQARNKMEDLYISAKKEYEKLDRFIYENTHVITTIIKTKSTSKIKEEQFEDLSQVELTNLIEQLQSKLSSFPTEYLAEEDFEEDNLEIED